MAHLNFQAGIRAEYYKDNGDDATILLWLNDFMLSSTSDEIGFSHDELLKAIPDTLSEYEEDTLLNWFADNYGTPYEEWYSGDADIIRQCTGLKDMTGKLIYEGDIVKSESYPFKSDNEYHYAAEICFDEESAVFFYYVFRISTKVAGISHGDTGNLDDYEWEVIGNIHENPELIGGNHD